MTRSVGVGVAPTGGGRHETGRGPAGPTARPSLPPRGDPMFRRAVVALLAGAITAATGAAANPIPVRGTSVTFDPAVYPTLNDRPVRLTLTGVGLRTRVGLSVYAVASYVQDGAAVRTAEDVAKADAVRLLHLVMERTVEPAD